MTPHLIAAGFAAALCLSATPALAAESATLERVVVDETIDPATEGTGSYAAGATSTATGLTLSLRDTPQSVTVLTRERMDDQAATSIADALRGAIGVSLKPVDRGRNNLSVRGFDVNNFQLDGVPTATGNIGLETGTDALYDRIEVVRGATGLLSGAGDPSAAVNLVRKHADATEFAAEIKAELGSWEQRNGSVDLSSPLNAAASVRGRVVAAYGEQDAFIDLEHTSNVVFYAVIDADLGESTRLSVGASHQEDRRRGVLWAGLPYWYSDGTRTRFPRSMTTATRWNRWNTIDQAAFATLAHSLPGGWSLRGTLSYHSQDEDSMLLWLSGDPDPVSGAGMEPYPYHYLSRPKQIHGDVSATGPFTLGARTHELTVGVMRSRLRDGWHNADPVGALPEVGDIRSWDGSYPEPAMTDFYVGSRGTTRQLAGYAAARIQLADRLKLIAGGRLSQWERDEEAGAWTPAAYTLDDITEFTPYAGLVYDLGTNVSAYASYTDSFKPQTSRDRNGNYLDPLLGASYEAGLKGEFLDGRVNAVAAVFRTDQDNFAVVDAGFLVPGTNDPAMRAAQGVEVEGYELELVGDLTQRWQLSVGWTQFSARDAEGANVAVDHAREQFKLFTTVDLAGALAGLTVGGGLSWEGARPATAVNPGTGLPERVGQGAFALVDLMAKYVLDEDWTVQLNATNLLDRRYRSGSYWWGSPYTWGEPRKLLLTMTVAL